MSNFSNGFPVNELGEIVTTTGSGSRNIIGTLPIGMIPVDNTTGGLKLANVATLATDAEGNAIGLGGGAPASGVPFGPPTTIFRLRMRCSGGASTVTLIATKRSGGSESLTFSLASGDDVSESIFASDYSSLVWYSAGAGTVTVEVI